MADFNPYPMSDFLQGRVPSRPGLQDVLQQMLRNGEMEPSDLAAVMAPPTLGGNIAMRPPSAATITNGKGSVQPIPTQEALGQHNALHRLLSSFGQPGYDMMSWRPEAWCRSRGRGVARREARGPTGGQRPLKPFSPGCPQRHR